MVGFHRSAAQERRPFFANMVDGKFYSAAGLGRPILPPLRLKAALPVRCWRRPAHFV
jgi:hypothetical protein